MKTKTFLIIFWLPLSAWCQSIEMRNYELESNPVIHQLTSAEQAEPAVVITDKRVVEYIYSKDDNLEVFYYRHRLVHINEDKSIDEYNKIYIPLSDPEMLISFKARSISKNGKTKEMLKGEMKPVTEKKSAIYVYCC